MIQKAIHKAVGGRNLSEEEMQEAMTAVMGGQASPAQIGALLVGLRMKGETVEEITAAARVMRGACHLVNCAARERGELLVDTCGTGGDNSGTFNVSTVAAFVTAGAGARVAKHGNRAVSSRSGSADLMEALGVNLDLTPEEIGVCLDEVGLGFLFAQKLHPAMRFAAGPRRELGLRTIFNLLGPLTNPAGAGAQVLGVFEESLTRPLAEVLGRLGSKSAFVVHGRGGYDEITVTGVTRIARLHEGKVEDLEIAPEDLGFERRRPAEIRVEGPEESLAKCRQVLAGEPGAARDMVCLNAGAALTAAGLAADLPQGVRLAQESLDQGQAQAKMAALVELSQRLVANRPQAVAGAAS
ncbi:MAG: anthranilate phosphoribosyltransferase [Deltaproteobacteria bacterium]|nr:anthranilate phosphoribosyltransferase [Deltaproteobacteria bacterium]